MINYNAKIIFGILLAISTSALTAAFIAEYIFKLKPCYLCLYQRVPYLFIIIAAIIGLLGIYIPAFMIILFAVIAGVGLAGYHTGIERKFIISTCANPHIISEQTSLHEALNILKQTPVVDCRYPAAKFLKLSLTEWNLILNLFMLLLILKTYKKFIL